MDERKYTKRKEKARSDGNREMLAQACHHLGDFYNQQGRFLHAAKQYEEEASLYQKMEKRLEMARAHRMIGEMYMLVCDFEKAKQNIDMFLKVVKQLQNKVEEQRAFATLGRLHLLHGQTLSETSASNALNQLRQAEKAFLRSLLITKELSGQITKLEQVDMQARCYLNIGVVKEHMEDFEESVAYIEKAIKICRSNDLYELLHTCFVSMSLLYHCKKNDPTSALRYCNLALDTAKRLGEKVKKLCETLIIKAEILIKASDFASAKKILTKAYKKNTPDENDRASIEKSLRIVVKICEVLDQLVTTSSTDYVQRKSLYEKLGDCCCHLQHYTKAIEYYNKMLEAAELNNESGKSLIPIYVSLYQTYKDNKQYDEALEFLWKEYHLNKDVAKEAVSTLCAIAEVCELQLQPFWTIQDVYQKAKEHAATAGEAQFKLEKIVFAQLRKLQLKHNMSVLVEELDQEATSKGIDIGSLDEESDTESDNAVAEGNTPDFADDVCLENLTDSDTSDLDETDKPRPHRPTRGVRSLTIKRNNKGETQLHQACIAGNLELVRRLIDQGHVVNVRDHAGWLPLHEACNHGFRDIVEELLERGGAVAINDKGGTSCDGITPLYDACCNGFLDVIELLLEKGADTTVKTDFGETCLSALDKWRKDTTLTQGEQAQYEQIRSRFVNTLSKTGICSSQAAKALNIRNQTNTECYKKKNEIAQSGRSTCEVSPSSDDEEENVLPTSSRNLHQKDKLNTSASAAYKSAIEQLKRPYHRYGSFDADDVQQLSAASTKKPKRPAYLDEGEIDDDAWLVNDLEPERKKRRLLTTPTKKTQSPCNSSYHRQSPTAVSTQLSSPSKSQNTKEPRDTHGWHRDSVSPDSDAFRMLLNAKATSSSQQRQKQVKKLSISRSSSISSNGSQRPKSKQQTSLLDSGFCRFRSESPQSVMGDYDDDLTAANMNTAEPDSTTTSIQLLISPHKSSPIKVQASAVPVPTAVSFKVKVEEEMLLVPIERKKLQDINIRWLAEEAARRYYNLVGLKPLLRLKTPDGFAYEENDPVSVAIGQNMISATVLEWQISPLGQRYEEMCMQLHREVKQDVLETLERAQISNSLQLVDKWLTPVQSDTVFRAVLHQSNLMSLDLSNNFIQNEGCRQLAKVLPTLKKLQSLNISGNYVTSEGVAAVLSSMTSLTDIQELILSRNPLGNNVVRSLGAFCQSSAGKSLRKLHLSQCGLTDLFEWDLAYNELLDFDISFNSLTDDSLRVLLSKLNSCRLQVLRLNYVSPPSMNASDNSDQRLTHFFESGTCEKFKQVELAGCNLTDVDMYTIAMSLSKASNLELLNISDNNRLTGSTLHFVLDKMQQLKQLLANNCIRLIDADKVERIGQLQRVPNLISITMSDAHESALRQQWREVWRSHWGDKGKEKMYGKNLILYVHDKDLKASL